MSKLALYGHPLSSYTWKARIALHAAGTDYAFHIIDPEHPENTAFVAENGGPWATFPVLADGDNVVFESTSIIEYLGEHYPPDNPLIPDNADAAIGMRMLDRTFDNYVMAPMQALVAEHIRAPEAPDPARCGEARVRLERSYRWLDGWLAYYPAGMQVSLVECSAAPALFFANRLHPISEDHPKLRHWLNMLQALPPVAHCIAEAEPFLAYLPGAV
jgi:glutathione S-transferase